MIRRIFEKKERLGHWTIVPQEVADCETIQKKAKELNRYYKKVPTLRPMKARVNPLPYGMAQLLILVGV